MLSVTTFLTIAVIVVVLYVVYAVLYGLFSSTRSIVDVLTEDYWYLIVGLVTSLVVFAVVMYWGKAPRLLKKVAAKVAPKKGSKVTVKTPVKCRK